MDGAIWWDKFANGRTSESVSYGNDRPIPVCEVAARWALGEMMTTLESD